MQTKQNYNSNRLKGFRFLAGLIAPWRLGPLRPINLKDLYALGWLHGLRQIKIGDTLDQHAELIIQIGILADQFVKNSENKDAFPEAIKKMLELVTFLKAMWQTNPNHPLTQDQLDFIVDKGLLSTFDSALIMELDRLPTYLLERKRGYAVEVLISQIDEVLPADDRTGLSEFARDNMQEAGACLAFHRFTACGYHMSRAVEDVARRYYELIKGRSQQMVRPNGETRDR